MGLDGLIDVVHEGGVVGVHKVLDLEIGLGLAYAAGGDGGRMALFIDDIVGLDLVLALFIIDLDDGDMAEGAGEIVGAAVKVGALVALTRDDKGGPGLVDKYRVDLVDDGEEVAALDLLFFIYGHVVPEVIEADLVVGAVGYVAGIGLAALLWGQAVDEDAAAEAHEAIDLAHQLALVFGQIVVDRDDVDTLSAEGVKIGRKGGRKGLALAGLHFGYAPLVQDDAADQLDMEGILAEDPAAGLAEGGKGLGQDIVEGLSAVQPGL